MIRKNYSLEDVAWEIAKKAVVYASVYGQLDEKRARTVLRTTTTSCSEAVEVFLETIKYAIENGILLNIDKRNGRYYCGLCKYMRYNGTSIKAEKTMVRHIFQEHPYWIIAYAEKLLGFCRKELEKRWNGAKPKIP